MKLTSTYNFVSIFILILGLNSAFLLEEMKKKKITSQDFQVFIESTAVVAVKKTVLFWQL
jgi:hypothetical protein